MRNFWRGTKSLLFLAVVLIFVDILYTVLFGHFPTDFAEETLVGIGTILLAGIIAAAFNNFRSRWRTRDAQEDRSCE